MLRSVRLTLASAFLVLPFLAVEASAFTQQGVASFYADKFHGRKTASGERFNNSAMTAAHKTLPFGTRLKVTSLSSGKSIVVRVNDRGPFVKGRIIDLSKSAARQIGISSQGLARVRISRL